MGGGSPVVVIAGGVGGARLADGLQANLGDRLAVIVNTGDDCERHGLLVMPDHDTVLYNLAGIEQAELGWGIEGDTHAAMGQLGAYGEETWFALGDRDLALHVARTARLRAGGRLTEVCLGLQATFGIRARILPMSDQAIRTQVRTDDGWLEFQEYFVHRRQAPEVREVRFGGVEAARPTPEVLHVLAGAAAIVIAPSNPIVSVRPVLAVPGMRDAILAARARGVPVVAVSPIVGGRALKGPADRMLASMGFEASATGVARLYADLVDWFVLDRADAALAAEVAALGPRVLVTDTIMSDDAARARLAGEVLGAVRVAPASPVVAPRGSRGTTVVVPVRSLEGAKSRLGDVLDAEERRDLVTGLLGRTVAAALATPGVAEVVVVSPDPEVLVMAAAAGARPVAQRSRGLNQGIAEARDAAPGAGRLLVLPADIPGVSAAALAGILAAGDAAGSPSVVLAPDRHGRGTNALLLDPPGVIDPAFGGDSRAAHAWLASSAGVAFTEADGLLGLDVDTAEDLLAAGPLVAEAADGA